jgi:hypothetical protein
MPTDEFTLCVPADAQFRSLVPAVVKRYVDLAGGSDEACETGAAGLAAAVDHVAGTSTAAITLTFHPRPDGVRVSIHVGDRVGTFDHAFSQS